MCVLLDMWVPLNLHMVYILLAFCYGMPRLLSSLALWFSKSYCIGFEGKSMPITSYRKTHFTFCQNKIDEPFAFSPQPVVVLLPYFFTNQPHKSVFQLMLFKIYFHVCNKMLRDFVILKKKQIFKWKGGRKFCFSVEIFYFHK